jgi:hypothetical protein
MRCTLLVLIIVCVCFLQACQKKCHIECYSAFYIQTTGYRNYELDSMIVRTFVPDGTFSDQIDSLVKKPNLEPWWIPDNNDTTRTMYVFDHYDLRYYATNKSYKGLLDIEITFPSNNRTYKISHIVFAGPTSEQVDCKSGSVPHYVHCDQYVSSYALDGVDNIFSAKSNLCFLYLNK